MSRNSVNFAGIKSTKLTEVQVLQLVDSAKYVELKKSISTKPEDTSKKCIASIIDSTHSNRRQDLFHKKSFQINYRLPIPIIRIANQTFDRLSYTTEYAKKNSANEGNYLFLWILFLTIAIILFLLFISNIDIDLFILGLMAYAIGFLFVASLVFFILWLVHLNDPKETE